MMLEDLFRPSSLAVVGASEQPGKIGYSLMRNIIDSGYPGRLFPVNPGRETVLGHKCYTGLEEVPEAPEVAVIAIPSTGVLEAAEACGRKGVRHLVVISAGFKEVGWKGAVAEARLLETCRRYGMRMLGPNCLGLIDTHTPLNASFARAMPLQGEIGFYSQSGALCVAILDWSIAKGVGFSKFVSFGNKADLNEADFIEDAAADPYTRVILLYLESVADGRRFVKVASEASRVKPVLVLKAGISQAGAVAASSHTGALAGSDVAYGTAFKQAGVFRVKTMEDLFDMAVAFVNQPLPEGPRVAVVTNSGGPGILATDAVELAGLEMARFQKATVETLRTRLPRECNVYNPVDILGDATEDRYSFALEKVLEDPGVDGAIVLAAPTATAELSQVAGAVARAGAAARAKPLLAAFMGGESVQEAARVLAESGIPSYSSPERAVAAMNALAKYRAIRDRRGDEDLRLEAGGNREAVQKIFERVKSEGRLVLLGSEAAEVAAAYRIQVAPVHLARNADDAVELAESMGYPVALKIASPEIAHKTDVGGVALGIRDREGVRAAFLDVLESVHRYLPRAVVYGVEVQAQMPRGTELIVGMTRDVQFGPLVMFGLGGIYVNLLKDVSFRLAEGLSLPEIRRMVEETRAYTLLKGFRGEQPLDMDAVVEAVARVALLSLDFPEIAEMDINPLLVYQEGVSGLDVKITIS